MAETPTTPQPASAAPAVEKGSQLGNYMVAAGALKPEQLADLLDVQKIIKSRGATTEVEPTRAAALKSTYGAIIAESELQPKSRYLGELAVATGMVQANLGIDGDKAKHVVENLAAVQANHRLEMVASVIGDNGVNKDALVSMRSRGIFPLDINNLPEEHWLDRAPENVRRMQSQAGMVKLLAGNIIQGSPELVKSPDIHNAASAARKLAFNNNQELTAKFNELGLPQIAAMVDAGQQQGVAQGSLLATTPADDTKTLTGSLADGLTTSSNKLQLELLAAIQRQNENVGKWSLKRAQNAGLDESSLSRMAEGQMSAAKAMLEVATERERESIRQKTGLEVNEMSFTARFGDRNRGGQGRGPGM